MENTYDGFDRVIQTTDAVGNVAHAIHDPGGRVIETNRYGPIGGETPENRAGTHNVLLTQAYARFDEAGRQYESQRQAFVSDTNDLPSEADDRSVIQNFGGLATNSTTNGHTSNYIMVTEGVAEGEDADSYVLSRIVHDAAGRVIIQAADNASLTHMTYDGASRMLSVTDSLGNVVENTYDGNSNVIHVTRTEKCTITEPTVTDEIFELAMYYDCLNQLVVRAGQGADGTLSSNPNDADTLFTVIGYNSRGNNVIMIDPKKNTTITVYDGANRPVESHQHLRVRGEGDNPPEANSTFLPASGGTIRTVTVYDGNSRVKQLIDDRGAPTNYAYDALDRQIKMIFQDGSTRLSDYNAASDVIEHTDENGSVFRYTYDPLGRRTVCEIIPVQGVAGYDGDSERGTTGQSFEYDGLSRMTLSIDTTTVDGESPEEARVVMVYDSLGRVVEDAQTFDGNDRYVTNSAFTSYPASEFTFPNARQITNTFDDLYRRTLVEETSGPSNIASWQFFGTGRVAEVQLANGLICTFMNNDRTHSAVQNNVPNPAWGDVDSDRLGYDGAGRMIAKRYLAGGIDGTSKAYNDPISIVGFVTAFDKASNKLFERHLHAETRSHLYQPRDMTTGSVDELGYDSIDRLRQYQRGEMNDGSGGGQGTVPGTQISTAITLPNAQTQQDYTLDDLGNWKNTAFTPVGDSQVLQRRDHNHLNQITATKDDAASKIPFTYDGLSGASNGNLINDGMRGYLYDGFNRLVQVEKTPAPGTPTLIGTYTYDALGRRIRKTIANGGLTGTIPNGTTDFVYTGWRCVEERDPFGGGSTDTPTKQYVWGIYIDELIQQKNLAALNNFDADDELYSLQDLLYRNTGLADDTGVVREAYDCDAYGNTLIFRNSGSPPAAITYTDSDTQVDYPTSDAIFTGQRYDADSGLYYYRTRYYEPQAARFVQRDAMMGMNTYRYVGNKPTVALDPMGLQAKKPIVVGPDPTCNADDPFDNVSSFSTNCLSYAANDPAVDPVPQWYDELLKDKKLSCETIRAKLKSDPMYAFVEPEKNDACANKEGCCPDGYHKIYFMYESGGIHDFHFVRQEAGGEWTQQPGDEGFRGTPIMKNSRKVDSPEDANYEDLSGINYNNKCGYLCAPTRPPAKRRETKKWRKNSEEIMLDRLHNLMRWQPEYEKHWERMYGQTEARLRELER